MRWTPKPVTPPRVGEQRQVVRFAVLPTQMADGSVVWLESYIATQQYTHVPDWDDGGWYRWETVKREQDEVVSA